GFGRVAAPLTGSSLIPHRRYAQDLSAGTSWSRATNERGDYDDQTRCIGSAVPRDRYGDGSGAQGHIAHVQRSAGESRQGSSDDHSRACARRIERDPPTQCTCLCLRAGGLRCDAAEGWTTGNTDTRTELL